MLIIHVDIHDIYELDTFLHTCICVLCFSSRLKILLHAFLLMLNLNFIQESFHLKLVDKFFYSNTFLSN